MTSTLVLEELLSYNVTSLARMLHELPHVDRNFQEIENIFRPDRRIYIEALLMAGSPFFLVATVTLLHFIIYRIFSDAAKRYCACCNDDEVESPEELLNKEKHLQHCCYSPRAQRIMLFTVLWLPIFALVILNYAVYANHKVLEGAEMVSEAVLSLQAILDREAEVLGIINERIAVMGRQASEFEANLLVVANTTALSVNVSVASTVVVEIDDQVAAAATNVLGATKEIADVDLAESLEHFENLSDMRWRVQEAILFILQLPHFLLFLGTAFKSLMLLWLAKIVGGLCLSMGFFSTGAVLSASVGFGDFCNAPSRYVEREATKLTAAHSNYTSYYLGCDETDGEGRYPDGLTNPLRISLAAVGNKIEEIERHTKTLDSYLASVAVDMSAADASDLNATLISMHQSAQSLTRTVANMDGTTFRCNQGYNDFILGVRVLCGGALEDFFSLVFLQGTSALITSFAVVFLNILHSLWNFGKLNTLLSKHKYLAFLLRDPAAEEKRPSQASRKVSKRSVSKRSMGTLEENDDMDEDFGDGTSSDIGDAQGGSEADDI